VQPKIEEPAPIPVHRADPASTERVSALLQIVNITKDHPKLKPLQDEALAELEVLGEEGRVRREEWNKKNAARNAEIERRKAVLVAKAKAESEIEVKKQEEANKKAREEALQRAANAPVNDPRVVPSAPLTRAAPAYDPSREPVR
jgi:septal ring factor EnvC (AmiA/AmiB activator)